MVLGNAKRHRRSIRLKGYDYAQAGAYFVTICTQDRACLFGDVVDGQMRLNKCGQLVADSWLWLSARYPHVDLDEWMVMPNHLHGIIILTGPDGRGGSRTAPTRGPMAGLTESVVESAALGWLEALGYQVLHGPDIAVGQPGAERNDPNYRDVVLDRRLRQALVRLNPDLPDEAIDDAFRKLTRADAPSLLERNRAVHRMFVAGVNVEYRRSDGSIAGAQARVIDFDKPENND